MNAELSQAAGRLYRYLLNAHWNGQAVWGPDPGVRINARVGRFLKSYTRRLPWADKIVYVQAQKYWIMCNWLVALRDLADAGRCKEIALACSEYLLDAQHSAGYWEHPNREWQGRVATVEGNYGAMGLLSTYHHTRQEQFLEGAKRWYRFAVDGIRFRGENGLLAINYFANRRSMMVPNVSVSALRTFAWLAHESRDDQYLENCEGMVRWLLQVQRANGELPYAVASDQTMNDNKDRIHFLCYQYNAFELLNLAEYYRLTGDHQIWPVLENLARFVARGVTAEGACRYNCQQDQPEVSYYTAASAAALHLASELHLGDYRSLSRQAYQRVLSQQRADGNMQFYSRGNYKFLSDRRSYPRYLSMTLYLILMGAQTGHADGDRKPVQPDSSLLPERLV